MLHLILAIIAVVLIAYGGYTYYENKEGEITKMTRKQAMIMMALGLLIGACSVYCYSAEGK